MGGRWCRWCRWGRGFLGPFFEGDKEAVEGGVGLFDAGEFVGGDGSLVGFVVVVGHGYVYSGSIDGDCLHVDGSGKGIIYYYTLADRKQFEIGRELFAFAY